MANNASHSLSLGKAPFTLHTPVSNKFVMRTDAVEYGTYNHDIDFH